MEGQDSQKALNRIHRLTLKELGIRIGKLDHHLIALLSKRADLAKEVEEWKSIEVENDPLIREVIETERLQQISKWAEESGMNPNFARAVLYFIIGESCRTQIKQKQARDPKIDEDAPYKGTEGEWYSFLKQNLLSLTEMIAPTYDQEYGDSAPFATSTYLRQETNVLTREIGTLVAAKNIGVALDLGCATGRMSFLMAPHFKTVLGYDISPAMIDIAYGKMADLNLTNTSFVSHDIEIDGIPLPPESVSLVVMNLGTASDIPYSSMQIIIRKIKNVLNKDGRFLLSFYNSAALFNHYFLPWPTDMLAQVNPIRHCLDVRFGGKVFRIHARPYSVRDARRLIEGCGLKVSSVITYPTVASLLPKEFFLDFQASEIRQEVEEIDKKLAGMKTDEGKNSVDVKEGHTPIAGKGAYILITGRKE